MFGIGVPSYLYEVGRAVSSLFCWSQTLVRLMDTDDNLALRLRVWIIPSFRIDSGRTICRHTHRAMMMSLQTRRDVNI